MQRIQKKQIIEEKEDESETEDNLQSVSISVLEQAGISANDIKKLQEAGFNTIQSIVYTSKKNLLNLKGLTEIKIDKIIESGLKILPQNLITAANYLKMREKILRISTGSTELDNLLQGGVESHSITELFGEFRCGKTQLCHTLCITAQMHPNGGKAMYIDTEGTFRPERLIEMSERFGLDSQVVLDNVVYARAHNCDTQNRLLLQAAAVMSESRFVLLIVDSATCHFRNDYLGRGELSTRQQHLAKFLKNLQRLAEEFGVAVVVTNQVMSVVDGSAAFMGDQKKPIGGNIMAHACQTRLQFRKGRGESRICKVYDSPSLPESEATFAITKGGIDNFSD